MEGEKIKYKYKYQERKNDKKITQMIKFTFHNNTAYADFYQEVFIYPENYRIAVLGIHQRTA